MAAAARLTHSAVIAIGAPAGRLAADGPNDVLLRTCTARRAIGGPPFLGRAVRRLAELPAAA
jgi:hypothetical protein